MKTKEQILATIENIRACNGYRESDGDLWLGARLHDIEDYVRESDRKQLLYVLIEARVHALRKALYELLKLICLTGMNGNPYCLPSVKNAILALNAGTKLEGNKYDIPKGEFE